MPHFFLTSIPLLVHKLHHSLINRKAEFNKKLHSSSSFSASSMAYLEPVVEDLFVESTAANPDIHKKRRRQNNIAETVGLRDVNERIGQENRLEMKRIAQEMEILVQERRKQLINRSVVKRPADIPVPYLRRDRRKSHEFEDLNFPTFDRSELSEYDNLTAFVSFGRAKTPIVRGEILKQALSDQRLNTLKDLKLYQHWEGDPEAINSVRRPRKPIKTQMEHLNFSRSRRFDARNEPIKTVSSPRIKPVRESHTSIMRRVLGKPNSVEEEITEGSNVGNKEEKTTIDKKSKGSKGKHKLSLGNKNKILPH